MHRCLLLLVTLLLLAPLGAAAQERYCNIQQGPTARAEQAEVGGVTVVILHDPFEVRCDDGAELRASSGRLNRGTRELHLVGDVFFRDEDRSLTAAEATYSSATGRLWARGDVVFVDRPQGSALRGPELEYYRATEQRPEARVLATQRPRLTLEPRDAEPGAPPLELIAERIDIVDGSDLSAFGEVVITRADLHATSAEARYDSHSEALELRGDARIRSEEYELVGEIVNARLSAGSLEHLHARERATLLGEEVRVDAPEIELFFADAELQRAVTRDTREEGAEGRRSVAIAAEFRIEADSLDAGFRAQRIDEVVAVGTARAETLPIRAPGERDEPASAPEVGEAERPASAEADLDRDWIRGDTIVATFAPATPAAAADPEFEEGVERQELRRLVARGSAQSLYRVRNQGEDSAANGRPNVNFLVGAEIELDLVDGELQIANVTGLRRGLYLDATQPVEEPSLSPEAVEDPAPPATEPG